MKITVIGKSQDVWTRALLSALAEVDFDIAKNGRVLVLVGYLAQITLGLAARLLGWRVFWLADNRDIPLALKTLLKANGSLAHKIIVPNQACEIIYLRLGIVSNKLQIIYPPCDVKADDERRTSKNGFALAADAAVGFDNGLSVLLRAFGLARDILGDNIKLIIGGRVNRHEHLEWSIRQLGLSGSVQLTPGNNFLWLAPAMVYVFTPTTNVSAPLSLLHALAAGLALVACDQPSAREFALADKNALIIKSGDAEVLSQAIIHLARDPELLTRLQAGSREFAATHFAPKVFREKVTAISSRGSN